MKTVTVLIALLVVVVPVAQELAFASQLPLAIITCEQCDERDEAWRRTLSQLDTYAFQPGA